MSQIDYSLIFSFIAFLVSIIALIISIFQFLIQKETLSLATFINSLEQTGTNEAREARDYIFKFPDLTLIQGNQSTINSENEMVEITYYLKTDSGQTEHKYYFVKPDLDTWKKITDVAVRIDRIGFIIFNINLPKKLKNAYLEWWSSTIIDLWNRLAPYIFLKKLERENYTPYFEKLAVEAFTHYQERKKDAKLIVLTK